MFQTSLCRLSKSFTRHIHSSRMLKYGALGTWTCSGESNFELIKNLHNEGHLRNHRLKEAMLATDRAHYILHDPYVDSPQPIGYGQTISAPHMHASACESIALYLPEEGAKILDIGCGSGYVTAVLARLAGNTGRVWGIDNIPQLVDLSIRNIEEDDASLLSSGRVTILERSGWQGVPEAGGFDIIHCGAAVPELPPNLMDQLKIGGVMVIPIGPEGEAQTLVRVGKKENECEITPIKCVVYHPLEDESNPVYF